MIRTQIYLPDDIHSTLLKLAREKKTTLSRLVREGASEVIKKNYGKMTPQQRALRFFANPPKKYRLNLTGSQLIDLIRKDRDE